jgi:sec-independent protein translocase protein TatB
MFDIGWTEMLVIAVVMIVVVGPKDLPKMLRAFGRTTAKMRAMAGDFQKQFNEALREAELEDVKKSVESLKGLNPANEIRKQLNPLEKAAAEVRAGLDTAMKPKPAEPAADRAVEAEPLKTGAAAIPGAAAGSPENPAPGPQPQAAAPAKPAAEARPTAKPAAARRGKAADAGSAGAAPKTAAPKTPRKKKPAGSSS